MDGKIERKTWTDSKFVRDKAKIPLNRNECYDKYLVGRYKMFLSQIDPMAIMLYPNLRDAYEGLRKLKVDPEFAMLCEGAEGAIRSVIEANRDALEISIPRPTYEMVEIISSICGLKITDIPYDKSFKLDFKGNGICYIANPDSCTGTLIGIEKIEDLCNQFKVVIVDEAYYEYSGLTCVSLIGKLNNLFVIRSFSKGYGVAGIRIGAVISCKENINNLTFNKPAYEVSSIACEYLKFISLDLINRSVNSILTGKKAIECYLSNRGLSVMATNGNFVLVKFDENLARSISRFADVKVLEISGDKYIRITSPDAETSSNLIESGALDG